jgi:hypothetical protein
MSKTFFEPGGVYRVIKTHYVFFREHKNLERIYKNDVLAVLEETRVITPNIPALSDCYETLVLLNGEKKGYIHQISNTDLVERYFEKIEMIDE